MPSRFISFAATILRSAPSTELKLKAGHRSRISCFVNLPILFCTAFRTISTAGIFFSTIENRSLKSLYAAMIVLKIYLINGVASSLPSCQPFCDLLAHHYTNPDPSSKQQFFTLIQYFLIIAFSLLIIKNIKQQFCS